MEIYEKRIESFYDVDWSPTGLIGRGGFAEVYLGRCYRSGKTVAVKRINKQQIKVAKMEKRVCEEVQIHSRLKHPSILELYEFFEDHNFVFLVLEYAENGELQKYLKLHKKRFDEVEAAKILKQVVEGLLYLHTHNIMHRDISLTNLLLTKDMTVKIADFGLATKFTPQSENLTLCGTPNYISPEVASRSAHGPLADVWGIGCMLYTLLVGRPPFDTDGIKTTLVKVMQGEYSIPSYLSSEASNLIKDLLRKNPSERIALKNVLSHPFVTKAFGSKNSTHVSSDSGIQMSCSNRYATDYNHSEQYSDGFILNTNTNPSASQQYETTDFILNQLANDTDKRLMENHKATSLNLTSMELKKKSSFSSTRTPHTDKRVISLQNFPSFPFLPNGPQSTSTPNIDVVNQNKEVQKLSVPPLNTTRILPTRHRTNKMILSVSNDGSVIVEMIKFSAKLNEDRIMEVLKVSGDGMSIIWYQPLNRLGEVIFDVPIEIPEEHGIKFTYHNVPQKHHKKYVYAYKFVQMVKAKTPKITIYSSRAKFQMMETLEDFECFFYNEVKILKTTIEGTRVYSQGCLVTESEMSAALRDDWNHFQECLSQCLKIHQVFTSMHLSNICFPIIMGRRPQVQCLTATKQSILQFTPEVKSPEVIRKIMLPNIGKAYQYCNGTIEVHYFDGSVLAVPMQSKESGIFYTDDHTKCKVYYNTIDVMPQHIQDKLNQVPLVLKHLKNASSLCLENKSNRSHEIASKIIIDSNISLQVSWKSCTF